jgi:arginyl-tRNA synthetase
MDVKQHIIELISRSSGAITTQEDVADSISDSPVADYGSTLPFKLAKKQNKNPVRLAEEIAGKIQSTKLIEKIQAVNGYVNFWLNRSEYTKKFLKEISERGKQYGGGQRKGRIILEHTSVNPTGPVHVGRLRNTIIGDSLRRILEYTGYDVETHYYVNDIGKQIAVIGAGRRQVEPSKEVGKEYGKYMPRKDYQLFSIYVPAYNKFEEDDEFKNRVQKLIQDAETGDKKALEKITAVARECLEGQKETFKRLDVRFDAFDYESKSITDGSAFKILEKARKSDYWRTADFGSGLDLSSFSIEKKSGLSVLIRGDGTTVYLTRDLAYHLKKEKLAGSKGILINVLGEDHKLEFAELKTILERILEFKADLKAVHYSFVSFEGEKFSTRKGKIASVDVLLDEAVEKALVEVRKRKIADESIAGMVGTGAVKFHIIKTHPNKQMMFNWSEALDFEGETAPYIQYAHARSCRILEKAGEWKPDDYSTTPENEEEWQLIRKLASFPEALEKSVDELRPDVVANYLLELTAAYGRFYMKCPVLDSGEKVRTRRLLLVKATRDIVKTGLSLLGIQAPERM